jgi:hypothetical protein
MPDGHGKHQNVYPFSRPGLHHLLMDMRFSILKGLLHQAGITFFGPVLVNLVAFAAIRRSERLPVEPVGLHDSQIAVLDGYETGNFLEKQPVTLPAVRQLVLKVFQFGYIGGHLDNIGDLAGIVSDGSGVYQHMHFSAVYGTDDLFALMFLTVSESSFDRAVLAFFRPLFVNLVTVPSLDIPKILTKRLIRRGQTKLAVLYRYISGNGVEYPV